MTTHAKKTTKLSEGVIRLKVSEITFDESRRKDLGDLLSLANSISSHGLIDPIVVDEERRLIAGLRRLEAVKLLKWEEIEARCYSDLSPAERRKVEIEEDLAQKKVRTWQEEVALKAELHALLQLEKGDRRKGSHGEKPWSQKDTATRLGIAKTTLSEELRLAEALKLFPELANASTKKDAIRKMYMMRELALLQSIAKDMKELGIQIHEDVELRHGDAFTELKQLADESFDLCITDPPWGIEIAASASARSNEYTMFKDTVDVWTRFLNEGLPEISRILKEGSHFWLFFGPEHYQKTRNALERNDFDVRYVPCIWVKERPNFTDWEYKPAPQYESFFFAVRRKNKEVAPRRLNEATSDYFLYPRNTQSRIHRTEKPIELVKRLISLSSMEDDRILDPFAGSGSTLCAAMLLGRKALGFEFDKDIYESAQGRLQTMRVTDGEGEEEGEGGGEVKPN